MCGLKVTKHQASPQANVAPVASTSQGGSQGTPVTASTPEGHRAPRTSLLQILRNAFRTFVSVLPCGPRLRERSDEEQAQQTQVNRQAQDELDRRVLRVDTVTTEVQQKLDQELARVAAGARLAKSPKERDALGVEMSNALHGARRELGKLETGASRLGGVGVSAVASVFAAAALGKLSPEDRQCLLQAMQPEELRHLAKVSRNSTSSTTSAVIDAAEKELERRSHPEYEQADRLRRATENTKEGVVRDVGSLARMDFGNAYTASQLNESFANAEARVGQLGLKLDEAGIAATATLFAATALGGMRERDFQRVLRAARPEALKRLANTDANTLPDSIGWNSTDSANIGKAIRAAQRELARREYPASQALRDRRAQAAQDAPAEEHAEIPAGALEDIEKEVREQVVNLAAGTPQAAQFSQQIQEVFSSAELRLKESGLGMSAEDCAVGAGLFVAAALEPLGPAHRDTLLRAMGSESLERVATVDVSLKPERPVVVAAYQELVRRQLGSGRTFESAARGFLNQRLGSAKHVVDELLELDRHLVALTADHSPLGKKLPPDLQRIRTEVGLDLQQWLQEMPVGWEDLTSEERKRFLDALPRFSATPPEKLVEKLDKLNRDNVERRRWWNP